MMDRRTFISTVACSLFGAPFGSRVQSATIIRRIGYLEAGVPGTPAEIKRSWSPLWELGWVEGENLLVERRYANGKVELLRPLAEELVRLKVELIVTEGTDATLAAKNATSTIPIVFRSAGDPVRSGIVANLSKPGGNITGYSVVAPELDIKRLELLRELLPGVQRVGVLENSTNPYSRAARKQFEQACRSLGIQPLFVKVVAASELKNSVAEVARQRGQALFVPPDALFYDNRVGIMRAAQEHALPTIAGFKVFLDAGALLSYTISILELRRRNAAFIDRILRGAKPADLPIEQPSQFELGINLKTAKALGITVPQSLLLRADEVVK